ncbi:transcriptional regulator GcvA [Microvirga sp. 17 mud 1-3]|uniref:transcriptional regulator GcvA n=1 Tax=Microvirga sp. 17 mud 1-3 TaxID=2082949 RepID=UPI000D6B8F94|nr:transcriptional regulator GcvA [Microvirga sp. 17 mud 1-3]AWM88132.1 LysR family transcriptional regulator [Microvirga sp. 17 mud 1-3]
MFDRLPPLQTLRAFEAAGRLSSMTLAAEELHVTHGAVSRHIKTLEDHLGVPLFRRLTRRIVLTDEGARLLVVVTRVLAELTREAEGLRAPKSAERLTISVGISFASKWLGPRLHRLIARHPEFDIHLDITDPDADLSNEQIDAAVRYGHGRYPHLAAERILEETLTPVCSPAYRAEKGGLLSVESLAECRLLHEDRLLHDDRWLGNWDKWFAMAGVEVGPRRRGPIYSHGSMAIEAAIRGEGVALGRSALVAEDIAAGRLVALFPHVRLESERGYDLVYRPGKRDHPKVCAVRDWLADEIRQFLANADPPHVQV